MKTWEVPFPSFWTQMLPQVRFSPLDNCPVFVALRKVSLTRDSAQIALFFFLEDFWHYTVHQLMHHRYAFLVSLSSTRLSLTLSRLPKPPLQLAVQVRAQGAPHLQRTVRSRCRVRPPDRGEPHLSSTSYCPALADPALFPTSGSRPVNTSFHQRFIARLLMDRLFLLAAVSAPSAARCFTAGSAAATCT